MTYRTIEGETLDLTGLTDEERRFVVECWERFCGGASWDDAMRMIHGRQNPQLARTGGVVTRDVWYGPMFRALLDIESRAGMRDGSLQAGAGVEVLADPFADEWIPAVEAAEHKEVSLSGLHGAIRRGEVIATPGRPGGTRIVVSRNSLSAWRPNEQRQKSARARTPVPR